MSAIKGVAARVRAMFSPRATEQALDDEIQFHVDQETEKNVRLGMSRDAARREALVQFGGLTQAREAHHEVYAARPLEELASDVRYTFRTMRRTPALAGAAILTLALGVGANTAIFSAVNAVILQPLPFANPDQLYMLWEENPEKGWYKQVAAPANMLDWKEQVGAFADVMAYSAAFGSSTLIEAGEPTIVKPVFGTGNFFSVLGARPALGRTFTDAETWQTGQRVTVLSHRLWRDRFGSDPKIIGRSIQLDGAPVQVVGVMPASFAFPSEATDLWQPWAWKPENRQQVFFRRAHWLSVIARVKPAVTQETANAQLQSVVKRLQTDYPVTNKVMGAGMTPLHEFLVGDTRLPLFVLLGAVGLLLLIACANVGNLLLVKASGREREAALRLALGAGRRRLIRQALTESLVMSLVGGLTGVALGWWGTRALQAMQPEGMLRVSHFDFDWTVLAYVLAVTTMSGLLFGIAPALWSSRRLPLDALKEGGRGGSQSRRIRRWGERLVIGEVALALMLSIGAGLLVRSLIRLQNVDPGFDPNGVLAAKLELPGTRYDTGDKVNGFFTQLEERLRGIPGVQSVGGVSQLALETSGYSSDFTIAGWPAGTFGSEVWHRRVTPDYFKTMKTATVAGRPFTVDDRANGHPVVIINEALARKHFRGEDPIGRRMSFDKEPDSTSVWRTIVGVVKSEHQTKLSVEPNIEVFEPLTQSPTSGMFMMLRTSGDPASLGPAVRRTVAEMDGSLALESMRTMNEVFSRSLARERFLTTLLLLFAGVGLALAVVGVYGVMAQMARRRVREMGIRLALGAQANDVRWLVVRNGLRLVTIGLVVGTAGALVATRAMQALLFGVATKDPLTFVAVSIVLVVTAVVATWVPATFASRADPATALRAD
ncbi:MAG TPA: ABC transporter permease [Gemmatimonadaceae bacterium]|nr:ABC transporter permease [Gemmatimonadaceae bacterium]